MTFAIGDHQFDHVTYDRGGDVLYVRSGESRPAADIYGTPEGHAVRFDKRGSVIGLTIVNAQWLISGTGRSRSRFRTESRPARRISGRFSRVRSLEPSV